MFVLGISWLVLTPLCLWNLFRGGRLIRLTSVMVLVSLEAATIWASSAAQPPPADPGRRVPVLCGSSGSSGSSGERYPSGGILPHPAARP